MDSINGFLSDTAAEAGVPAPVNDQVASMIREIAAGVRSPSSDNLNTVDVPSLSAL